jgi:L-ascorbate metabolism protein UlaG (beta-lactamase superfamily)
MNVKYLGHAAFELTSEGGTTVVFDPYESGSYDGALRYGPITGSYDLAVISHEHPDHCDGCVKADAKHVVDGPGEFDFLGLRVEAKPTFHDESEGGERGGNLISVVEIDGMRVAHLGDLGHALDDEQLETIRGVDLLLIPVGGFFTIDARAAADIVWKTGPKVVVPMHFKTGKVDFPIAPVDQFTSLMDNVEKAGGSAFTLTKDESSGGTRVVVLDPEL